MAQTFPAVEDHSVSKPAAMAVAAAGYAGSMLYLAHDARGTNRAEIDALHLWGVGTGFVYETTANRTLSGAAGGQVDARIANEIADELGVPDHVPLVIDTIDFEATQAQIRGPIADYGRATTLTSKRPSRGYGAFIDCEILCGEFGIYPCMWQCAAWSYGRVSRFACLYQTVGYVLNRSSDHNNMLMGRDELLWHPRWPESIAPSAPTGDDMADQFRFPDGNTYQLTVSSQSDTGYAWVAISMGPAEHPAYADGIDQGITSGRVRQLAAGADANDAMFERHPVLSGPHKRATHS